MAESDSGWFLRHRDGVEHGPFRLADLVSAAEAGNVADDTSIRHETHTRGQWVLAPRVQPIATAMSRRAASLSGKASASTAPAGTPPSSGQSQGPGTAPTPSAAPKSAFRRPRMQPPSALPGAAPYRSPRPSESAVPSESESSSETTATHPVRIYNQTFPVPKRFLDAALTLFDFRFRYFITPWIIKILWGIVVAASLIWFTRLTYDLWIQPSMDAPGPRTAESATGWEFEPLAGQSIFQSRGFVFAFQSGVILLYLLCARVAMETTIVFFRVASDFAEMKRTLPKDRDS